MAKKKLSRADWSIVEDLYISDEFSIPEIAEKFDYPPAKIFNHIRRNSLHVGHPKPANIVGEPTSAVQYLITTRGPKPLSEKELLAASGVRMQRLSNYDYASKNDLKIVRTFHKHIKTPGNVFLIASEFDEAYDFAKKNNCVILVYDLFRFLVQLSPGLLQVNLNCFTRDVVEVVHTKAMYSLNLAHPDSTTSLILDAQRSNILQAHLSRHRRKPKQKSSVRVYALLASCEAEYKAKQKRMELRPEIKRVIFDLKNSGKVSLQLIADELNRREITSPRGRPWSKGTVSNILKKLEIDHRK